LVFGYNQIERGTIWYFNKYKYYFKKIIGARGWETPAPFERHIRHLLVAEWWLPRRRLSNLGCSSIPEWCV